MKKDFDKWNVVKKFLNNKDIFVNFHEREIWWSSFGINVGNEQDGNGENFERPVVILKKLSGTTFICVPLSTKKRLEKFQSGVSHENIKGYALIDQIKVLDVKRLLRKVGIVDKVEFNNIKDKVRGII